MIVIKLELWPLGDESRKEDLGTAHLAMEHVHPGTSQQRADYSIQLLKGAKYSNNPGSLWREGEVKSFPRQDTTVGPWELLYLALESALGERIARVRRLCGMDGKPVVGGGEQVVVGRSAGWQSKLDVGTVVALQQIDAAISQAMDALESDSDLDARRAAFETIQDLYEPGRLLAAIQPPVDDSE